MTTLKDLFLPFFQNAHKDAPKGCTALLSQSSGVQRIFKRGALAAILTLGGFFASDRSACALNDITLTIATTGTIHFLSANPTTTPSVPALENPVTLVVVYTGVGHWAITVTANGDLTSGTDTIPISNISWTASGTGFISGTLSKTAPQPVTTAARASHAATGFLSFYFNNKWTYPTGNYTQTITFTATSF